MRSCRIGLPGPYYRYVPRNTRARTEEETTYCDCLGQLLVFHDCVPVGSRADPQAGTPWNKKMLITSEAVRWTKLLVIFTILLLWRTCLAEPSHVRKSHHTENGFRNIHIFKEPGIWGLLKWRWDRLWMDLPSPESFSFPPAENDPAFLRENRAKTTITWIGHATVLLQLAGMNILTDPHFSERASPVQWAGPRRVVPPGLALESLPPIDLVVLSHDHYDSLDTRSIASLFAREGGDGTTFYVPLGLKKWFEDLGITRVVELDWWRSDSRNGVEVTAVPVHHWSKRGLLSGIRRCGQDGSFARKTSASSLREIQDIVRCSRRSDADSAPLTFPSFRSERTSPDGLCDIIT